MILQALTQHYEDLLARGDITPPGWGMAKVSYALELSDDGQLLALLPLMTEQMRGKKEVLAPQSMEVPMPVKRTVGIAANFLCDNSGYLLGADTKGKPARTAECFSACKTLHETLLAEAKSPAARAVLAYFTHWDPASAAAHPALAAAWDDLMKGGNLIFWYGREPVFKDPEVRALWQAHYNQKGTGETIRCLVTGEKAPLEEVHPSVKGVAGAQMAGAALVSFNAPAFWSYGHERNANAPIGTYAAFAYTTALNHLISDYRHVQHIGDTTMVCWAQGGEPAYQDCCMDALYSDSWNEQDLQSALAHLARGEVFDWNGVQLDPDTRFYVLGLAPNAARLSVRFFWQDSFGVLARNLCAHYERLEIVKPRFDPREHLSIRSLLKETIRASSRSTPPSGPDAKVQNGEPSKEGAGISPKLTGEVLRAILNGGLYPATLLDGVTLRIRAEHEVTRGRAAILKAYYLRNENEKCPKEVLTVSRNVDSDYAPYVLGRLFAVLEAIQSAANPSINATIKDKYFNAASSTPSVAFPTLINLSQKHLRKLEDRAAIYYDKQLTALLDKLTEKFPDRLTLPEQGSFQIGYYQEVQARYTKKEEN